MGAFHIQITETHTDMKRQFKYDIIVSRFAEASVGRPVTPWMVNGG
jgi:hypothetical protein